MARAQGNCPLIRGNPAFEARFVSRLTNNPAELRLALDARREQRRGERQHRGERYAVKTLRTRPAGEVAEKTQRKERGEDAEDRSHRTRGKHLRPEAAGLCDHRTAQKAKGGRGKACGAKPGRQHPVCPAPCKPAKRKPGGQEELERRQPGEARNARICGQFRQPSARIRAFSGS